MMFRTTFVGALALVAFVQVTGGVAFGTTELVDIVAQKLEDHLEGKNLDNKITIDECRAAFDEFEQWDPATYQMHVYEGPLATARHYLSVFLHKYLQEDLEQRLTNELIEKLESTYTKVRPTFANKTPLQCEQGITQTPETCALVASLTGKGEPVTTSLMSAGWHEIDNLRAQAFAVARSGRIYQDTDEFLEMFKAYNTHEVDALYMTPKSVLSLIAKESKKKLRHGDQEEIQKYMDTYKNELAECVAHVSE